MYSSLLGRSVTPSTSTPIAGSLWYIMTIFIVDARNDILSLRSLSLLKKRDFGFPFSKYLTTLFATTLNTSHSQKVFRACAW